MVFVDEAGFSMVPCLKKPWAPEAKTPVVRHRNRLHRKVSVIGALAIDTSDWSMKLLSDWHPDKHVTKVESTEFLAKLAKQFPRRNITLIWDKLQAHRSAMVREFLDKQSNIQMHFLPSYAPDLNPVEPAWSQSKYHRMANHGIDDLDELHAEAKRQITRVARSKRLLKGFMKHAGLLDALNQSSGQ